MDISLVINATTDHFTITLNPPAAFTLDDAQMWESRAGKNFFILRATNFE
jgi:hypothetical protein